MISYNFCPDELLGVVEAGLEEVGKVVVLGGADEAGDGDAGERAAARVEVVQQHLGGHVTCGQLNHLECFRVKLDNRELCLQQLGPVNLDKDND